MSIDFNTSNIILFQYPIGAGGKFVAACCGLSCGMVLSDKVLAEKQLQNMLSPTDKLEYLVNKISNLKMWNDFDLGCTQLLGKNLNDYVHSARLGIELQFNPIVATLTRSNLKFVTVAHTPYMCKIGLAQWPNARVVQFEHNREFYEKFRPGHIKYDEQVPMEIHNSIFRWDQRAVLNLDKFLVQLQELYSWLGLTDFDSDLITKFYNRYIATISKLILSTYAIELYI